ncbi:hypothetical protein PGT21_010669 [Puccinia graminis f. sp. tritici]|uniref:Uncharacterized protein n=1 Tax=Puccinia graminis f. sp. tritici TaxID=56615 RepID=A0A5B0S166_PUCGR|nr:hypothetical protein PGT21_010669 [Puccinia graminis f. sp. tritici]KAA1131502.1 hypothetical protein PGTUg99_022292 [Puccinia graminis f. sp. tritici]
MGGKSMAEESAIFCIHFSLLALLSIWTTGANAMVFRDLLEADEIVCGSLPFQQVDPGLQPDGFRRPLPLPIPIEPDRLGYVVRWGNEYAGSTVDCRYKPNCEQPTTSDFR